jgi:hypothetical protein
MKRLILILTLVLCGVIAKANPVGMEEARSLAQGFVRANFEFTRQSTELTMVYSQPAFYVFNVGETGFVIISSDDSYRPVVGFSQEGLFDRDNMAPALQDLLDRINAYRTSRTNIVPREDVVSDWNALRTDGKLVSRYGGRGNVYLVETTWNQNYPYNYCCPAAPDGPGGHVYAGCVATAAGQVMKFWNHPVQGQGSHTYTPEDHPEYGPITVNFGNTTYDWANMPNAISSASPIEQLEAVGTLIFHAGVSVDMNYRPTSSGAVTGQLCNSLPAYFHYTDHMEHHYRENLTREEYMGFIVEMIDMGWPMIHRGNGHAYVLDGYNDAGLVHFNWGWGGSNDSWFDFDDHNYADGESVICYCVPKEVYNGTPSAPTNLVVTAADNNELAATVSWTNPSQTISYQSLTSIDRIVVMRGHEVVYTEDNVTPGAAMSFVDQDLPYFDAYDYTVYAILNGQRGKSAVVKEVNVGPTCQWSFVVSSSNFQGWHNAYIAVYNAAGTEVERVTVNSSTPEVKHVAMPLGSMHMEWVPSEEAVSFNITLNIKDSDNNSVYNYSGNINSMQEGIFYEGNNNCGVTVDCGTPSALTAAQDDNDETTIHLQWTGVDDPGYGYIIYRDDEIIKLIADGSTTYDDVNVPLGGHCYQVATLCEGGMNGSTSNMYCEPSGACHAPRNLDFELSANFKCILQWDKPEPFEGLSGYELYRKTDSTDYKRIKLLNANVTSYTDNSIHDEGNYYYKIVAYYSDLDCYSAPAAYKYDPNQYYLHFYYSVTATDEQTDEVRVYPIPTTGMLKIEAARMNLVSVYNLLGQKVYEQKVAGNECVLNLKSCGCGMYMVRIGTENGFVTKKISVIE